MNINGWCLFGGFEWYCDLKECYDESYGDNWGEIQCILFSVLVS